MNNTSKMTRLTRLFFVEEISDNERENINSFKSFEMKSEVKTNCMDKENEKVESPAPSGDVCNDLEEISLKETVPRIVVEPIAAADRDALKSHRRQKRASITPILPISSSAKKTPKAISFGQDEAGLRSFEQCLLYEVMRPLFICMTCTGIFFIRRTRISDRGLRAWLKNCTLNQAYCIFVCSLLMINFLRFFGAFEGIEDFGTVLFFKFLVAIFLYEAVSRALLAYFAWCRVQNGLSEFFIKLEHMCYSDDIIPYEVSLKRSMHIFLILTVCISISNCSMVAYGMLGPTEVQELFNIYLVPVPTDLDGILAFKLFLVLIDFINSMVATLSLTFFSMVCMILYREFEYLGRTLHMKIQDDGTFGDDIEKFRIKHQKRCKLVEDADAIFKYYIANSYLTNIPLLCLLLYSTVYAENDDDVSYRLISAFRLGYVLLQMVVLSVVATMINGQAHAPLADIYSITVHDGIRKRHMEVEMFLNKLTGTSIGLTALDMFVINKPTMLTMFGMVLTYFFLLMQFKNPQEAAVCHCYMMTGNDTNITMFGHSV